MNYPATYSFFVNNCFNKEQVNITFYYGLTTFIGANASGKTQTLKALRDHLKEHLGLNKVRYLSSNRIAEMEAYRSKTTYYDQLEQNFNIGGLSEKNARQEIETATGDFFTLDERRDIYIKVSERLSVLFNRYIYLRWDNGTLKVFFEKTGDQKEYSVAAEASGLVNIISILAALFDETVEVLLIDEPEVSLHPQLQSYLLREIQYAIQHLNKTVVLSTHSPEMISLGSPNELCNLVFFTENQLPVQIEPDNPVLQNQKLKDFLYRMNLIYKEGFFAKKVLLIEGASDLILCRFLSYRLNTNLDVAGSQIIPVDGKGQFPLVIKFFKLIGKEVCVLTDLDGFADNNDVIDPFMQLPEAEKNANQHGNADIQTMVRNLKTDIQNEIDKFENVLKPFYETHPYWINRDQTTDGPSDSQKAIRRAVIGQLFSLSSSDIDTWPDSQAWRSLYTRLSSLFSILEKLGCFVLRKGAIENYYVFSPKKTCSGKPAEAVKEMEQLQEQTNQKICEEYRDVIRALEHMALTKKIDESRTIRTELLSELAVVLSQIDTVSSETEIATIIKQVKGNRKSLFTYNIINDNHRSGVEVGLKSIVINVSGFPLKAFKGDNVNDIVEKAIVQSIE